MPNWGNWVSEQTEDLLGNGTLTVASRLAAVGTAIAGIIGMPFLVWFSLHTLEKIERTEAEVHTIKEILAANGEHSRGQDKRLDRLDGILP